MSKYLKYGMLAISLLIGFSNNAMADDEGKALFGQCRGCHAVGADAKHQFGPVLNGVMDQAFMIAGDYDYSAAFNKAGESGLSWTDETMSDFLAAPMSYIPGTKMAFPGVQNEEDRNKIIAYLRLFDTDGKRQDTASDETAALTPVVTEERKLASDFAVPEHGVFKLGRVALTEEINAWDIDVRPDGTGLPPGSGDAITGGELYDAQCASCHGDFGEGTGRWPILAGGHDTLTDDRPEKTIGSYWPYLSTVYDYVRRAMPFGNARSLSDDDVYAITAYLLYLNDEVDEDFELSSENFSDIVLPNEANFIADNRNNEGFRSISIDELCMTNCADDAAVVTQRANVLDVTPDE